MHHVDSYSRNHPNNVSTMSQQQQQQPPPSSLADPFRVSAGTMDPWVTTTTTPLGVPIPPSRSYSNDLPYENKGSHAHHFHVPNPPPAMMAGYSSELSHVPLHAPTAPPAQQRHQQPQQWPPQSLDSSALSIVNPFDAPHSSPWSPPPSSVPPPTATNQQAVSSPHSSCVIPHPQPTYSQFPQPHQHPPPMPMHHQPYLPQSHSTQLQALPPPQVAQLQVPQPYLPVSNEETLLAQQFDHRICVAETTSIPSWNPVVVVVNPFDSIMSTPSVSIMTPPPLSSPMTSSGHAPRSTDPVTFVTNHSMSLVPHRTTTESSVSSPWDALPVVSSPSTSSTSFPSPASNHHHHLIPHQSGSANMNHPTTLLDSRSATQSSTYITPGTRVTVTSGTPPPPKISKSPPISSEFAVGGAAIGGGLTLTLGSAVTPPRGSVQGIMFRKHDLPGKISSSHPTTTSVVTPTTKSASLSSLIAAESWPEVEQMVQLHPAVAKVWTTRAGFFEGRKDASVLPLHEILVATPTPPIRTIQAVLEAHPEAIRANESSYARLPLHCTCRKDAVVAVVALLVSYHPDAVLVPDVLGRLPIHYALSNGANVDVVKYLLSLDARSAKGVDQRGWTPLHVACSVGAKVAIVEALLLANPEAVVMRTKKGSTPSKCLSKTVPHRSELKTLLSAARKDFDQKFVSPLKKSRPPEALDLL